MMDLGILSELPEARQDVLERYRDFRGVFLGTEEGKRVLRELLSWCHLMKPSVMKSPIDPYEVVLLEGERNLGLKIMSTILNEPTEKPSRVRKPDGR